MRRSCPVVLILTLLVVTPVLANPDVQQEIKQDVVLRALVDELARNQSGLELEGFERPYFIEFGLDDSVQAWVAAELGSVLMSSPYRSRQLRCELRVGSYELDNTNFGGGYGRGGGGARLPIEDDYDAIRQAIWWATDREYKDVVEAFEKKKAFMESKMIEDKPHDFSRAEPVVYFEPRVILEFGPVFYAVAAKKPPQPYEAQLDPLEELVIAVSSAFKDYPELHESGVSLHIEIGNDYLVNTEGTRLRRMHSSCTLSAHASVQADDGMTLADSFEVVARSFEEMRPESDFIERCRKMAEQLMQVKQAPKLKAYTGPVLFKPKAAAHVFSDVFADNFCGGQRPLGSSTSPDDFEKKIGKRVLPRSVDVVDDPTRSELEGEPVMGHYLYDDQGVKARPVQLVEKGKLQAQLMSRNPSKLTDKSTGHGRGGWGPSASVGCLVLTSEDGADEAALREELLEACDDEDLEYGIVVTSLGEVGSDGGGYYGYSGGGSTPLVMHKVFPDGKEELVRGAQFGEIDLKVFKRILAVGDKLAVINEGRGSSGSTVAARHCSSKNSTWRESTKTSTSRPSSPPRWRAKRTSRLLCYAEQQPSVAAAPRGGRSGWVGHRPPEELCHRFRRLAQMKTGASKPASESV